MCNNENLETRTAFARAVDYVELVQCVLSRPADLTDGAARGVCLLLDEVATVLQAGQGI